VSLRPAGFAVTSRSNNWMRGCALALVALLWPWTPSAWSQAPNMVTASTSEARPTWAQLTAAQKLTLEPLRETWSGMDTTRKQTWVQLAARMPRMTPEEQSRVRERMAEWVAMTPKERGQTRIHFQEARRLAPGGRVQQWDAYQALPVEQRRALAAQATVPPTRKTASAANPGARTSSQAALPSNLIKPTTQVKRNLVTVPAANTAPKLVGPTVVQSRQGATTSLVTATARPPAFHQAGLPKVNAGAGFVDPSTLLPLRGPQGAAATPPTLQESSEPATVDD
jgi:Protein of unknown function (DUF3106)